MKNQAIQDKMQNMLDEIIKSGRDTGIQLAVYHKGELVVNAWAGITNLETKELVTEHTMFPVFSTTKGITATMLHILADRGVLNYEQKICELWPEFAKHGKENITVRHVLDHTAGIPQMLNNFTASDLNNWEGMCAKIEDLRPLWASGERLEYHALTYGWIIGRVIELASKMSFASFLKEEVCEPLGIKSMCIGIPSEEMVSSSVATVYEPGFDRKNMNTSGIVAIPECCMPMCDWINQHETLQACIPAVNGLFSAHSVARHYAALLPGGIDGVSLLSEETARKATDVSSINIQPEGTCTFGLGYSVVDGSIYGTCNTLFGHGGYGGSMALADLENGFAMALTKNLFHNDGAEMKIVCAVQEMLGIPRND